MIGATGFLAWTDAGLLPTTKWLTFHDRTGYMAIDIGITNLDVGEPEVNFLRVKGLDPTGEPVLRCILKLNRVGKVAGPHESQHWAEALIEVEPGVGLDVFAHTRSEGRFVDLDRFNQPCFTWFKCGERS